MCALFSKSTKCTESMCKQRGKDEWEKDGSQSKRT